MIVDRIEKYLESKGKTVKEAILGEAMKRFRRDFARQLMNDREDKKPGHLGLSQVGKSCPRQLAYSYLSFPSEPLGARTMLKFLFGDILETTIIALGKLAGCPIQDEQKKVSLKLGGTVVPGRIDGTLRVIRTGEDGEKYKGKMLIEVKTATDAGYTELLKNGIDQSIWGYGGQHSCYLKALLKEDKKIYSDRGILVLINTNTAKFAEQITKYNEKLVRGASKTVKQVVNATKKKLPPRAFDPIKETHYRKETGKYVLPVICQYCGYKNLCIPDIKVGFSNYKKRPIFYVKNDTAEKLING